MANPLHRERRKMDRRRASLPCKLGLKLAQREKQLTFKTMGGETVSHPVRGKHYCQPRGYAYFPGTGPKGETCRTCQHCISFRRWNKCDKSRLKWTGGRASDILARAPACKFWEKKNRLGLTNATVMTEKEFLSLIASVTNPTERK